MSLAAWLRKCRSPPVQQGMGDIAALVSRPRIGWPAIARWVAPAWQDWFQDGHGLLCRDACHGLLLRLVCRRGRVSWGQRAGRSREHSSLASPPQCWRTGAFGHTRGMLERSAADSLGLLASCSSASSEVIEAPDTRWKGCSPRHLANGWLSWRRLAIRGFESSVRASRLGLGKYEKPSTALLLSAGMIAEPTGTNGHRASWISQGM